MGPTRLLQRAAEYRELARSCRTREEKSDYLELASRLSTLANADLLMPTKSSAVPQLLTVPVRGLFSDDLGCGGEADAGRAHYAAFLHYRFHFA
jgi:hypothetical protein